MYILLFRFALNGFIWCGIPKLADFQTREIIVLIANKSTLLKTMEIGLAALFTYSLNDRICLMS